MALGERLDLFIDGTFGRTAASLDSSVAPAADAADNALNVSPHAEFVSSAIYQFVPQLSGGSPEPPRAPFLELVTFDLEPGAGPAFEQAIRAADASSRAETRWFRLAVGGTVPRYLRMRPRSSVAGVAGLAALDSAAGLPMVRRVTTELLRLRLDLSLGIEPLR
jgi:hypothetical protein